jgi:hypothetical protein
MQMIWTVKVPSELGGDEWYYAGAESKEEALAMAIKRGIEHPDIEAKQVLNRFGIQRGDFRSAI